MSGGPQSTPRQNMPSQPSTTTRKLRWSRTASARLQVLSIWAVFTLLFFVSKDNSIRVLFWFCSASSLMFFLWPFIQGPYRLYRHSSSPLSAGFKVVDAPESFEGVSYRIADLMELAFELAGYLNQEPAGRNVTGQVTLFIHPKNNDSAQIVRIHSSLRTVDVLAFKTRFTDDTSFETTNSWIAKIFPPDPNRPVFAFPQVRSTFDLYRIHCKIKETSFATRFAVLADKRGELDVLIARAETVHKRHTGLGDYKLNAAGDRRKYTVRGAVRLAWLATWPVKSIREMLVASKAIKKAAELGFRIDPKIGRIVG